MAKVATSYFMCDVDAIGGDPRMTGQKRMILCYGASTGACNQPNRGEINIRELEANYRELWHGRNYFDR